MTTLADRLGGADRLPYLAQAIPTTCVLAERIIVRPTSMTTLLAWLAVRDWTPVGGGEPHGTLQHASGCWLWLDVRPSGVMLTCVRSYPSGVRNWPDYEATCEADRALWRELRAAFTRVSEDTQP